MSIGERMKMARQAAGYSLRALAEQVEVSHTAIAKYESGADVPSSGVLLRIAEALGVAVEYFFRPRIVSLSPPAYCKHCDLPRKQEKAVLGQVMDWLERYIEAEDLAPGHPRPGFVWPTWAPKQVASLDEAEEVADDLRQEWQLGLDPIDSLVELLEDKGLYVGMVEGGAKFDACTFRMESGSPVIAVKRGASGDRQQFSILHEVSHQLLGPTGDLDDEKIANRFAGAFLVPADRARYELGPHRRDLGLYELHLLKHKYGLSMQGWIYRARELGILPETAAQRHFRLFRKRGWHKQEPGDPVPSEQPKRMERLVLAALAEDLISESRAAELLGVPITHLWEEASAEHDLPVVSLRG